MGFSKPKMINSLRKYAYRGNRILTASAYTSRARRFEDATASEIIEVFGSWDNALKKAELLNRSSSNMDDYLRKKHLTANERRIFIGTIKLKMHTLNLTRKNLAELLEEKTGMNFPETEVSAILRNRRGITHELSGIIRKALEIDKY